MSLALNIPEEYQVRSTIAFFTVCQVIEDFSQQLTESAEDLTGAMRDNLIDGSSVIALSVAGSYFHSIKARLLQLPLPSKVAPIDLTYEYLLLIGTIGSMIKMTGDKPIGEMIVKLAEGNGVSDAEAKRVLLKSVYGRNVMAHLEKLGNKFDNVG